MEFVISNFMMLREPFVMLIKVFDLPIAIKETNTLD
jgi:hypothetical protein